MQVEEEARALSNAQRRTKIIVARLWLERVHTRVRSLFDIVSVLLARNNNVSIKRPRYDNARVKSKSTRALLAYTWSAQLINRYTTRPRRTRNICYNGSGYYYST